MSARESVALTVATLADGMWATFTATQRGMVRFGIFPAERMEEAEVAVLVAHPEVGREVVRLLAVALMDCAKRDGGMRA